MDANHKSLAAIAGILFLVATALFFVVRVTALYITAYLFLLIGIAGVFFGGSFVLSHAKAYPWAAAVPLAAVRYFLTEIIFSAIFVVLEQCGAFALPVAVFFVAQLVILAFFAIRVIMLKAGKTEIERVEEKVKQNTFDWRMLIADLEALAARVPEVKPVLDAVKYADPVTNPALAGYDEKIRDSAAALEQAAESGDTGKLGELTVTLQRQIKDRNNRAKLLK